MAADVHRKAEPFIQIGQRSSAVPAVQIQLIAKSQLNSFKPQIRIASPDFCADRELLLGVQNGAGKEKQKSCSLPQNGENRTDRHQLGSESPF